MSNPLRSREILMPFIPNFNQLPPKSLFFTAQSIDVLVLNIKNWICHIQITCPKNPMVSHQKKHFFHQSYQFLEERPSLTLFNFCCLTVMHSTCFHRGLRPQAKVCYIRMSIPGDRVNHVFPIDSKGRISSFSSVCSKGSVFQFQVLVGSGKLQLVKAGRNMLLHVQWSNLITSASGISKIPRPLRSLLIDPLRRKPEFPTG